jgi:hypothetical protein
MGQVADLPKHQSYVRFGSLADMCGAQTHVCFGPIAVIETVMPIATGGLPAYGNVTAATRDREITRSVRCAGLRRRSHEIDN